MKAAPQKGAASFFSDETKQGMKRIGGSAFLPTKISGRATIIEFLSWPSGMTALLRTSYKHHSLFNARFAEIE